MFYRKQHLSAAIVVLSLAVAVNGCGTSDADRQAILAEQAKIEAEDPETGGEAGESREVEAIGMTLIWCPQATFTMGRPYSDRDADTSEQPSVQVTLSRGFWLGQTEVTQAQWEQVMGSTPWAGEEYVKEGEQYPATCVGHGDRAKGDDYAFSALAFCKRLTKTEREAGRLPNNWEFRLPTEAQWEYSCRAGTTTGYCFGNSPAQLVHYAWFDKNAGDAGEAYAHQVALKKPNPWGFHDMHGNVWEWCLDGDGWNASLPGGIDPKLENGMGVIFRGGCWSDNSTTARSSYRSGSYATDRDGFTGFRVALVRID